MLILFSLLGLFWNSLLLTNRFAIFFSLQSIPHTSTDYLLKTLFNTASFSWVSASGFPIACITFLSSGTMAQAFCNSTCLFLLDCECLCRTVNNRRTETEPSIQISPVTGTWLSIIPCAALLYLLNSSQFTDMLNTCLVSRLIMSGFSFEISIPFGTFFLCQNLKRKKRLALCNSPCPVLGIGRLAAQGPWLRGAP